MLAVTHAVAGAAIGWRVRRPLPRTLAALSSHALLDGVGHDDLSVGFAGQGLLAGGALAALLIAWGPRSSVVWGALAAAAPDAEIALDRLLGQRERYLFPSHWQLPRRRGAHPYRYPGPGLHVLTEASLSLVVLAVLLAVGRRRSAGSPPAA